MKRSYLKLHKATEDMWHCVFCNNHGRKIYIKMNFSGGGVVNICDCFYVDRPWKAIPKKLTTKNCKYEELLNVFAAELDKKFFGIEFVDCEEVLLADEFIAKSLSHRRKLNFLILVDNGHILKTRLKNRTHRVIYLEITRSRDRAFISCCNYCDRNYKHGKVQVVPAGLKTIHFEFSLNNIIKIANEELNCDFTDVIITSDTFNFDKIKFPICGSI